MTKHVPPRSRLASNIVMLGSEEISFRAVFETNILDVIGRVVADCTQIIERTPKQSNCELPQLETN